MTQYLRGSFSVGAKPGETEEMEDNWNRIFGKKNEDLVPAEPKEALAAAGLEKTDPDSRLLQALEPIQKQILEGLAENERLRAVLKEVHRRADRSADAVSTVDAVAALTREWA